jgi:hypothetical protein
MAYKVYIKNYSVAKSIDVERKVLKVMPIYIR